MFDAPQKQLLNVKEGAAYLGLSTSSFWRRVKDKTLPKPIRIGGATRWRRSDLDAFIAQAAA